MKITTLILCLIPSVIFLSSGPTTEAMSLEKALKKGAYIPYTGQQQDWPRSDKHVAPIEIGRGVSSFTTSCPIARMKSLAPFSPTETCS
jgi:hypothetical protein